MKYRTYDQIEFWGKALFLVVLIYLFVSLLNYDGSYHEERCFKETTVVAVTKAEYRTIWITLADGTEREINHPRPAVYEGAPYCTDSRRVRNDEELSWWMSPWALKETTRTK